MKRKRNSLFAGIWLIVGILCIMYGSSVKLLGTGSRFYMVWIGMGIGFLGLTFIVKAGLFQKMPVFIRRLGILCISAGIICFLIVEGFIISGFQQSGEPNLDYIIVLGAQVWEHGPSVVLKYRLDKAIEYLEANPDTLCIVSGGQGYNEPYAEAVGMADYLEKKGIPTERIKLEAESTNTKENILFSKELMEEGASVGLVTNNFHVFRALQSARKYGLENVCGIAAGTSLPYLPNNMFREFFAEIKFLLLPIHRECWIRSRSSWIEKPV